MVQNTECALLDSRKCLNEESSLSSGKLLIECLSWFLPPSQKSQKCIMYTYFIEFFSQKKDRSTARPRITMRASVESVPSTGTPDSKLLYFLRSVVTPKWRMDGARTRTAQIRWLGLLSGYGRVRLSIHTTFALELSWRAILWTQIWDKKCWLQHTSPE